MLGLCEERYAGFTVKHFHEQMTKRHNYKLGHRVTRLSECDLFGLSGRGGGHAHKYGSTCCAVLAGRHRGYRVIGAPLSHLS